MNSRSNAPSGVPIGEQLGFLEYMVTEENLREFREAVGYPDAAFPNIVAREPLAVLFQKCDLGALESVTHEDRYFRPPVPGRRVQVSGWIRGRRRVGGAEVLAVETFAVDDIGTEILRSRHEFRLGTARAPGRLGRRPSFARVPEGEALEPVHKRISEAIVERFEAAHSSLVGPAATVRDATMAGAHASAILANNMGLANAVAPEELGLAYLHELVARRFGRDFRQGGRLNVSYRRPMYEGDTVTAHGIVRSQVAAGECTTWNLQVWLENGRGEQVITGEAQVTVPSPLT